VNTLLDTRDSTAERALATAGNLAHGLKTPLAVLTNEAERVRARGAPDVADAIEQQVSRMRRQVDYHLARARATSGPLPGARTALRESLDGLVRVLLRLHDTRDLSIEVDVNPEIDVEVLRSDADDILGNLLDNACRWARSHIQIQASVREGRVEVSVDDDGPGVPPELWDAVLQRGVRADESGSSGLGLAIARELTELYGGSIVLGPSPLGGLRVSVQLIHRS
jgi:signal transduction histidine kinase